MKDFCILLAMAFVLTGCSGPAPDLPVSSPPGAAGGGGGGTANYDPQPGDAGLARGSVYVEAAEILVAESYPVQVFLSLRGNLPTPCHQLRILAHPPDAQNRIAVDIYSLADENAVCIQILQPFEARIGLGSYPGGKYSVWVNSEQVGEFDS